jgi:hypothetical protein
LQHRILLPDTIRNRNPMAANPCPRNAGDLRAFADRLADGCRMHEDAIGIKQNTRAALHSAKDAAGAAEHQAGRAVADRSTAFAALWGADDAARRKLLDCRMRLVKFLGARWHAGWEPTGFPDRSTAVPRTMDPRYFLLGSLRRYFEQRPEHESAEMGATAALCESARLALHEARVAARQAECVVTGANRARRAALEALRKRCRGLVVELWSLLDRADPRWRDFGLKVPASPPKNVAAATASITDTREITSGKLLPFAVRRNPEARSAVAGSGGCARVG